MEQFNHYRSEVLRYLAIEWSDAWLNDRIERVERYISCAYIRGIDEKTTANQMQRGYMSQSGFME